MEIKYYKCDICLEKFDHPLYSKKYTDKNVLLSVNVKIGGVSHNSSSEISKHVCMSCLKKLGIKFDLREDRSYTIPESESFENQFIKLLEHINIYPQE